MKEQIIALRAQGMSYNQIVSIIGCAKSTVVYHCAAGQREKAKARVRKRRLNSLEKKTDNFQNRQVRGRVRDFQRREGGHLVKAKQNSFTWRDVKEKIGQSPTCYLTGELIDLTNSKSFHFDHIIPKDRGGSNDLDNLGILSADANILKSHFTVEELLILCKKVLIHNGYIVRKG